MGLRFQKSFNLGAGFKINLSKSGIGYSWGMPGIRKTKLCNGRKRTTFNIPGTGVSYIKETSKKKKTILQDTFPEKSDVNTEIENISATEDRLISDINLCRKNRRKIKIYILLSFFVCSLISIFFASSVFVEKAITAIMCTVLIWGILPRNIFLFFVPIICSAVLTANTMQELDDEKMIKVVISSSLFLYSIIKLIENILQQKFAETIKISYDLDKDYQTLYSNIEYLIKLINSNDKVWQITSQVGSYTKKGIYIPQNFEGKEIKFRQGLPDFLECNISCYNIDIGETKIYVLPDKCLCVSRSNVSILKYNDIEYNISKINITEPERRVKDACIVGKNWLHATKDGECDHRYKKDNYCYPVYQYGKIIVKIGKRIVTFYCSNIEKTKELASQLSIITKWSKITFTKKTYSNEDIFNTANVNYTEHTNSSNSSDIFEMFKQQNNKFHNTPKNKANIKNEVEFYIFYDGAIRYMKIKQYSDFKAELYEYTKDGSFVEIKNKTMPILSGFMSKYITKKAANTRHAVDLFIKFIKTSEGKSALEEYNHEKR